MAGGREPLDGGHLRLNLARQVTGARDGIEATHGPGIAARGSLICRINSVLETMLLPLPPASIDFLMAR